MSTDVARIAADLAVEQEELDGIVAALDDPQWSLATPAQGWTIADQIAHLAYFDGAAALAIEDPDGFAASRDELLGAAMSEGSSDADDLTLAPYREMSSQELLAAWRSNRRRLAAAAAGLSDGDRVEWYGPSMGAKSFLTARLMEAWAHGQDIVDTLRRSGGEVQRRQSERLHHVAQLGVITRSWSYVNRGLEPPGGEVRVELAAPSGQVWTWGPEEAGDAVRGPAEDFCLVVTQRRHLDDTRLVAEGELARDWLLRAQAFAGPPTDGPAPQQEAR